MSQYNKTVRMLFGVIAFLLFSKVSIMLGTTGWKDVCFLIGCYLFLYFFIFSLIDSAVGKISSFHQEYNKENIKKPFLKNFIGNTNLVSRGYKLIFNLGFLLILFLRLKKELLS
ncbi:hypothetical protein PJ163_004578 [Salmonella enterica]|nr:hypothetical protein [Salmonella enterica subsp. enterica serovar Typhimurium]EEJ3916758.1 hypothetical protein [Salmonella enterica subsp. enterica serovar Waral]EIX6639724.1 hypothetical protein [Salmonella enterica]EKJ9443146.1 hypothetical protein [Salmonella enterica]